VFEGATHVGDVVVADGEVLEFERVDGATAAALMVEVLDAVPVNVGNVRVGTSREWSRTQARKARTTEVDTPQEDHVEWLHVRTNLENLARLLAWWRDAKVMRTHVGTSREVLRARGVTPEIHTALLRNGALIHPEALGEERAAKKRERYRRQLAALRAACPWWWPMVEVADRAA
jgi:hypothetical protein